MFFGSIGRGIERTARPVTIWMSALGAIALLVMMFWVVADVGLRFFFNKPLLGSYEIVEYMMVAFVFMAFSYAQFCKTHIAVPILVERLPKRAKAALNSITDLATICIGAILIWGAGKQSLDTFNSHMTSAVLLIPKWPFQAITFIGLMAFIIAVLSDLFLNLNRMVVGQEAEQQGSDELRAI